jgi:hypothetical protein
MVEEAARQAEQSLAVLWVERTGLQSSYRLVRRPPRILLFFELNDDIMHREIRVVLDCYRSAFLSEACTRGPLLAAFVL